MNFREAESYLFSLGNEVETMKLGLDNIRKMLAALGDPQNNYLKVQVAGTNGKGSVCAFLKSICLEAKIKTGVFTSPHLVSITERINIDGRDISEDDFARHATRVREIAEQFVAEGEIENIPTFFEQITAIALLAFADAKVELAILETGLGGRLDATTAANAEIAVITRIDYDHQQYLGETIEVIAAEKAAIIRDDSAAIVIGNQLPEARAVIEKRLRETTGGNPTCCEGARVVTDASCAHLLPLVFPPVSLGLRGQHQIDNANVAVAVADKLRSRFKISDDNILSGLKNARNPGRLEYQGRYLFDGAHNVAGAKALRDFLDEFETRPITIIFGAMKDKNVAEIIEVLEPVARQFAFTQPDSARALTAPQLEKLVSGSFDREQILLTENVADALSKANEVTDKDGLILITGSLYLVGEAKKILNN